MEMNMRKSVFLVPAMAVIIVAWPQTGNAHYDYSQYVYPQYVYPWCAQFADDSGIFSCTFATYGQCRATVTGIGGYCMINPARTFAPPTFAPPKTELRRVPARRHSARR
jgi:hypothetical protein